MTEQIIRAEKLCVQSGHRYLLRDINWSVEKGQHWVVFGMNGCGKTTLLSVIAGFRKQSSGTLRVLGEEYGEHNVIDLRKRVSWVSSSFFDKIYTNESALQIVLSGLLGTLGVDYSVSDDEIMLAQDIVSQLHLSDKIDRPFSLMSKGERQNVLIARALISRPEILLLDEPATGLDVLARETLLSTVKELARETDITMIYVTHYPEEILDIFQHCMLIKHGRCFKKGFTDEIMTSEVLTEFFNYPVETHHRDGKLFFDLTITSNLVSILKEREGASYGNRIS